MSIWSSIGSGLKQGASWLGKNPEVATAGLGALGSLFGGAGKEQEAQARALQNALVNYDPLKDQGSLFAGLRAHSTFSDPQLGQGDLSSMATDATRAGMIPRLPYRTSPEALRAISPKAWTSAMGNKQANLMNMTQGAIIPADLNATMGGPDAAATQRDLDTMYGNFNKTGPSPWSGLFGGAAGAAATNPWLSRWTSVFKTPKTGETPLVRGIEAPGPWDSWTLGGR